MAYFAPTIGSAGLSVPLFSDIQQACLDAYQGIYGSTTYLGNDSSDFQWITALSLKLSDNMSLCQLAYNSRSPLTAIGSALDSVIKSTGIARLSPSASTVVLLLGGTPGTPINNAVVQDINGILWSLPSSIVIGGGGTTSIAASCQQVGAISAAANTVTIPVGGFTAGWTSVTNPSAATIGSPTEVDSSLRARQSISAALPSSTRLAGTQADLEAVSGVIAVNVLENQGSVTDAFGNLSHSLTCVVEGGVDANIAQAIFDNRGIGANTQGATVPTMTIVPVTDPNSGNVTNIGFVRAVNVLIYVSLSVHGLTLAFTSTIQAAIITAIDTYLNVLNIGEEVTQSGLYGAALSVMPNLAQPIFSIRALTLALTSSPTATADIILPFYEAAFSQITNIILTVV